MSNLLLAVMENRIILPVTQMQEVFQKEGISSEEGSFRVLILSKPQEIGSIEEYEKNCVHLPRLCSSFFNKQKLHATVMADYVGRIIIILSGKRSRLELESAMQMLQKHIEMNKYNQWVIAVGKSVKRVQDISQSYENAVSVMQNAYLYMGNTVLYNEDLQNVLNANYLESTVNLDRILQAFRDDEIEQMRILVTEYAEKVRNISGYNSEPHHPTSIRRMFIELTVYVLHIASDMGINVDALLDGIDPYTHLMHVGGGTPAIINWFVALCEKLRKEINSKRENKEDILIASVCAYIDNHLSEYDLSLSSVSAEVSISSSYLSRLFPKKKDVGFTQYIVQQRIEMVKDKLRNTQMSIDEIAQSSGFSSSSYLGKQFKKLTGLTPNAYRLKRQE